MKEKASKNYLLVGIICLGTILLTLYAASLYKQYKAIESQVPVLNGVIGEVKANEIHNYLLENQDILLFICKINDTECRNLESELKSVINKRSLANDMVYVNIADVNVSSFFNDFNSSYKGMRDVSNYPVLVLMRDGKVFDFVDKGQNNTLTIDRVVQFLDMYQLGA